MTFNWRDLPTAALEQHFNPRLACADAQQHLGDFARRDRLQRPFRLRPRMLVAVGGDEPEGWQAQSTAFSAACKKGGLATQLMIVPGANHFTTLERAVSRGDPLYTAMSALWRP